MSSSLNTVLCNINEQIKLAIMLINEGADVNKEDSKQTPLELAIEIDNASIIKLLLGKGADPNPEKRRSRVYNYPWKYTPLHLAAKFTNNVQVFKLLVISGADVNGKAGKLEDTPLHYYVSTKADDISLDVCRFLIDAGAQVNSKNIDNDTPLHRALSVSGPKEKIVKLLIQAGANVRATDCCGDTPLHVALTSVETLNVDVVKLISDSFEVCGLLINAGAQVNAINESGETPLHKALCASSPNENILKLLIQAGANVRATDCDGETPLHVALYSSEVPNFYVLKLLLEAGADVNAKNQDGQTPLHTSLGDLYADVNELKFLLEAGCNVNDDDNLGETSLTILIDDLVDDETDEETRVSITESLKLFIAYCDINHTDIEKRNILARVLEKHHASVNKEYFYRIVLEHLAKLKILEVCIDQRLLDVIEAHDDYRNYFTECVKELKKTKNTKLDGCWVSYFNLLTDDKKKLVMYAGNENLLLSFTQKYEKFSMYETELQTNLSAAIEARKLLDAAMNIVSNCCPIFDPYHLIIRNTLDILSEEDWKNLVENKIHY